MLDMICLNEDRHLNNLAIIMNGDKFTPAPIFDNGIALLTANQSVNRHFPIADNVKRIVARPFSGSHEKNDGIFWKRVFCRCEFGSGLVGYRAGFDGT